MNKMQILLVEDKEPQIDAFSTAVDDWNANNAKNGHLFELSVARSKIEAHAQLQKIKLNCALVDIRIPNDVEEKPQASNGNDVIKSLLSERGIPTAVISGNPKDLNEKVAKLKHVKVFDKGNKGEFAAAIDWFASHWAMMEVLRDARHTMEKASAEIFNKRLWPYWSDLPSDMEKDGVAKIIARQYASHLSEMLGLDNADNVDWHPYEAYVSPSLNTERAHTGDIFEFDDELWIILTPQCDMATQKVGNVILALCTTDHADWPNAVTNNSDPEASATKKKSAVKLLGNHVNQKLETSQHFLPPLPNETQPVMVQFGNLMTMPLIEINKKLGDRKISVSSPFLSNLTQRFGANISRTGQPNININMFKPEVEETEEG